MKIQPENSTLGARISDIDLRVLNSSAIRNIYEAWHEFAVLVFPKQHLDDKAHISFSSIFGGLERLLTASIADENPEICRVSNVRLDGRIDKLGDSYELHQRGNQYWHTDSSYKNVPSKASVLRAITVPESGGATEFADMRAAYDALDIEYRTRLEHLNSLRMCQQC